VVLARGRFVIATTPLPGALSLFIAGVDALGFIGREERPKQWASLRNDATN
jgi:hypothetical protein